MMPRGKFLTLEALYIILLLAYKDTTAVFNLTIFETTGVNNGLKMTVDFANNSGTALCINDLGDGIATLTNLPNTSSPWTYTYQYTVPNFCDVYITCHNDEIMTSKNITLYFGDAIEGLDIRNGTETDFVAIIYPAANATLNLYVGKGSNLTFNVSYINTFEGKNGSNYVSFDSNLLPHPGLYQINAIVSNPLNNASDFVVFALEEPIQGLYLHNCSSCNYVEANKTFTLDFTLDLGSDVTFILRQMNTSNITQRIVARYCSGLVRSTSITYALHETGIYNFETEVSNYIIIFNPIKQFIQISAVYSVNNITYTIENPIHLYNETMNYTLIVDWSALVPMGPILCNVTFGNENFTITSFNLDVTNLSAVTIDGNSPSLALIQKSFTYGLAGIYKSAVECSIDPALVNCSLSIGNLESNYIEFEPVFVLNPVDNIHLLNESNYIPFSTGSAIISVVLDSEKDLPLANITCVFNFGGETNVSMLGTVDAVSNITAQHRFSTKGKFSIYVMCFNNLSSMNLNLTVEVYIDCFAIPYFFDEPFKNIKTPIWAYVTDSFEVASLVETTYLCKNGTAVYKWNIYLNTAETLEYNPPFSLPNKSVLIFPAQSVAPHTQPYKVVLNVSYSSGDWLRDYIYVDFRLPSLVAKIDGGLTLIIPYDAEKTSTVNASSSHDPVTNITGINLINSSLNYSWRCYFLNNATDEALLAYLTQISSTSILMSKNDTDMNINETDFPGVKENCSITDQNAGNKTVTFTNTFLRENIWTMFMFKITRKVVFNITRNRFSMAVKALKAVQGEIVPVAIKCIYNCKVSNKLAYDDVQLEMETTNDDLDSLGRNGVSFRWEVSQWDAEQKVYINITGSLKTQTGVKYRGIYILKESFIAGKKYLITAHIYISSTTQHGTATNIWYINEPPYGGTCVLNKREVNATFDKIKYKCSSWKDEDERDQQDPILDNNPKLTFSVYQDNNYTNNDTAKLLLNTGQMEAFVITLVGDPIDDFNTTLIIRVVDMFDNYAEVSFIIQSRPYDAIRSADNLTAALEDFLEMFTTTFAEYMANGHFQSIINLCLSSASQMMTRNFSQFVKPPLVDSSMENNILGRLLGTMPNSNQPLDMDTWMAYFWGKDELSPEIAVGQEVIQFIAQAIILSATDANISLKDPSKIIQISNAFDAVISDEILTTNTTKNLACHALNMLKEGLTTLTLDSPSELEAVQGLHLFWTQTLALLLQKCDVPSFLLNDLPNNLAIMVFLGKTVAAISPNFDKDRTLVKSLDEARVYLHAMISIFGDDNMAVIMENSQISPDEMAFIALKTQLKLSYRMEKEFSNIGLIQELVENITSILTKNLRVVPLITKTFGTDILKYRVRVEDGNNITATDLSILSTKINMNGIEGDYSGKLRLSLTSIKEYKGVYKNDPDGNSRFLTSETARLETAQTVKSSTTFRQMVQTPTPRLVIPIRSSEDASGFISYIKYFSRSSFDTFCTLLKPTDDRIVAYKVYISRIRNPTLISYDVQEEAAEYNDWKVCVSSSHLQGHIGVTYMAIKAEMGAPPLKTRDRRSIVNKAGADCNESAIDDKATCCSSDAATCPFHLSTITASCMTWNEEKLSWQHNECDMTWQARESYIECNCDEIKHRTLTFGNTFYVAPNAIDFSTVFLKFSPLDQAAVTATLVIIFITYIMVMIWSRWQDRRDILKWGITPLADNYSDDNYFYLLKVYTGFRPGAGTKSRIALVVAGDLADTGVRELSDGVRKEFKTGTVMNFLMSVPEHIGAIQYLRIWHDNSGGGESASWYLSKIEIYDIQNNERFTFMAQQWLSVENNQTECIVSVTATDDLSTFKNRFYCHAKRILSDSHMWVSVLYRPTTSNFTRVERASCVLVFIMLSMISSAMYYNPGENYQTENGTEFGPIRFTLNEIYVSFVCALITTPATIVVITLFKKSRRRYRKKNEFHNKSDRSTKYRIPFVASWYEKHQKESLELEQTLIVRGLPRFEGFWLPSWSVYIGWALVVASTILPAFFTILFSMQWGKQKSEEWLTAFLLSFLESIFCIDPVKVLLTAFFLALLIRSFQESEKPPDRAAVLRGYARCRIKHTGIRRPAPPLNAESLRKAQDIRYKELRMREALQDIVINLVYVWILFSISFSNRDDRSYSLRQNIENRILASKDKELPTFLDIHSKEDFFMWLNKTALPSLFPEGTPSGQELHWREREFIAGFGSYRLGPPRLRQLRVKEGEKWIPNLGNVTVFGTYDVPTEARENYCYSWKKLTTYCPFKGVYGFSSEAWKYTNAIDIWGFPLAGLCNTYSGGGYIAQLAVNLNVSRNILNELRMESWIDRGTRAVLLEFTLYCVNLNLFTYGVFMVEFPETGGAFPSYTILPIRVYQHVGSLGIYTLAYEVLYLVYFFVFGVLLIYRVQKQRLGFFESNWQIVDLVDFIIGAVAIGMYFARMVITNLTIAKFKEDPKRFVNFQHLAFWDQVFVFFISQLVFIATIRFLKILGHNKHVQSMVSIVVSAGKELKWYCIVLTYVILAYAVLGNLIFGSHLDSYKNIYSTLGTLSISIVGLIRFTDLEETDFVFSKIYFLVYIFTTVYILMTMILSILNKSIEALHRQTMEEDSEELVQYVLTKLRGMLGFSSALLKKKDNFAISELSKTHWPQSVSCSDSSLSEEQGQVKMDTINVMQEIRDALRHYPDPEQDYSNARQRPL